MKKQTSNTTTLETTQRIVRVPKGGWRWQDPYRVQDYALRPTASGSLKWIRVHRSAKMTLARVRASGYGYLLRGGIGNRLADGSLESHFASPYNRD
jgi:hypothetical protein